MLHSQIGCADGDEGQVDNGGGLGEDSSLPTGVIQSNQNQQSQPQLNPSSPLMNIRPQSVSSINNKQAVERFMSRKKERRVTARKKTQTLLFNNALQSVTSQNSQESQAQLPLQPNFSGNRKRELGQGVAAMSQKMLTKHQNILEKQKKLFDELQRKNQEAADKDTLQVPSNQPETTNITKKKTMAPLNRNSMTLGPINRTSKLLNMNFMNQLRQKIQEVEEKDKNTFSYKFHQDFKKCKIATMNIMLSKTVEIGMGIGTIFTLYSEDLRQVAISPENDDHFQIIELIVLIFFLLEIVILSICKKDYFLRFNFWMDAISTASMFFDIDFLTIWIFGFSINFNQVNFLKASRVSRIATRATKLVRFIRLLRLTKLQMLYKQAYENLHLLYSAKEETSLESQQASIDHQNHSNQTSQQNIETDRLNPSYGGIHSDFQLKIKSQENKDSPLQNENLINHHQQFRKRMNSFDKHSISGNVQKNFNRRKSYDTRDFREKDSPLRKEQNYFAQNQNQQSLQKSQQQSHNESNQQIDSGEFSNPNVIPNNFPNSPLKKVENYRKSLLSHQSHNTSYSHDLGQQQQQMGVRIDQIKLSQFLNVSQLPQNQSSSTPPQLNSNNLKSISFVNPGMDTPKLRMVSETDLNDSKSRTSFGSHTSFGFEETQPNNLNDEKDEDQENIDLNTKRMNDESKIGQRLANKIINRVIIFIFVLVVCIPFFDDSIYMSTDQGFDTFLQFLRDQYDANDAIYPLLLNIAVQQGQIYDTSDDSHRYPLIYYKAANNQIFPYPPNVVTSNLRTLEESEFTYNSNKDNSVFDSIYNIKIDQDLAAYLSMGQTTFIMLLLAYSTIVFVRDINKLVVSPIERMLQNIKQIADNPLLAAKISEEKAMAEQEMKKNRVKYLELAEQQQDETYTLESTIMKIGALLAIGFGEAGSKIITKNMQKGGRIDPMIPGKKIMAIFGFCSIKNFSDATEILQEKVMIFANEIAELVHICCDSFHGAINKNLGDCFLLVWKFTEDESQLFIDEYDEVRMKNLPLVQNLADLPVIAFLKAIANSRLLSLQPNFIQSHLKPLQKAMPSFKLRLGFGLHVGWGIEGAIGSSFKIDASYLSPNVNLASRIENATKQYGLYMMLSGSLYRLLSPKTQQALRHVDRVTVKGSKQPMDLYTCDVDPTLLTENKYISRRQQDTKVNKKVLKFISRKRRTERYKRILKGQARICQVLDTDVDIFTMRQNYSNEFRETYHEGLQEYFDGDWITAKEIFEEAQLILKESFYRAGVDDSIKDGPIMTLTDFMGKYNFKAPGNWFGYRVLVDK